MKKSAVLISLVLLAAPVIAFAADGVLFVSPERGTYTMDDVFEVDVRANTDGESAFAAEADLAFNPQALSVERISTEGSVLALWPTPPEFSNAKGTIRFSGTAAKSFSGADALLIRIKFRATSITPGDIHIDSGAILKNDARATNIITAMRSGLYTIVAHQTQPAPQDAALTESAPIESPAVKGVSVQVPTIIGYDDKVMAGERIILQGTGSPDTTLTIYLQHDDDTPYESTVLTARDGTFTYVARDKAERGMYRAWADVKTETETFTSDKAIIAVGGNAYAAAVESIGPMLTMALPYLLLLIVAGASLGFLYNRRSSR